MDYAFQHHAQDLMQQFVELWNLGFYASAWDCQHHPTWAFVEVSSLYQLARQKESRLIFQSNACFWKFLRIVKKI